MWRSLGRMNADRQRSIEKVQRRVSVLADGSVDRAALARSIVASRSLLSRNDDIGRLLEGLQVPFTTLVDEQYHTTEKHDLTVAGTAAISGSKDNTPNIILQTDRFGTSFGIPLPRQTLSASAVVWSDNSYDRSVGAGLGASVTQRQEQIPLHQSRLAARPSALRTAEDPLENVNASATPNDTNLYYVESAQTSGCTGNPLKTPATESEELVLLPQPSGIRLKLLTSADRLTMKPTETENQEQKEDGNTEAADVSVDSRGPMLTSSVRNTSVSAERVTLQDNIASNARAHLTRDIHPANSIFSERPIQGLYFASVFLLFIQPMWQPRT